MIKQGQGIRNCVPNLNPPEYPVPKQQSVFDQVQKQEQSIWSQVGEFIEQVSDFIIQHTIPDVENQDWKDFQEAIDEVNNEPKDKDEQLKSFLEKNEAKLNIEPEKSPDDNNN